MSAYFQFFHVTLFNLVGQVDRSMQSISNICYQESVWLLKFFLKSVLGDYLGGVAPTGGRNLFQSYSYQLLHLSSVTVNQSAFTRSNLTIETLAQGVKYVQS